MMLPDWDELPQEMRCHEVWEYYCRLSSKRAALTGKRAMDVSAACLLLAVLSPVMALTAAAVKLSSPGEIIFRQTRVTVCGREFTIYKFRTMTQGAAGCQVTASGDDRVTAVGRFLRRYRLDELPQLVNVLKGEMSLVGARPEVPRYVACYTQEMLATLLLPAGMTSKASIRFRNEERMLSGENPDAVYRQEILPQKMTYNLEYLRRFGFWEDVRILAATLAAAFRMGRHGAKMG